VTLLADLATFLVPVTVMLEYVPVKVQQAPASTSSAWQAETLPERGRELLKQRGSLVRSETSWHSAQEGKEKPNTSLKGSCPVLELLLADVMLKIHL